MRTATSNSRASYSDKKLKSRVRAGAETNMDGQSELNKKLRRRMPEFILIKENGIVAFPRNLSL